MRRDPGVDVVDRPLGGVDRRPQLSLLCRGAHAARQAFRRRLVAPAAAPLRLEVGQVVLGLRHPRHGPRQAAAAVLAQPVRQGLAAAPVAGGLPQRARVPAVGGFEVGGDPVFQILDQAALGRLRSRQAVALKTPLALADAAVPEALAGRGVVAAKADRQAVLYGETNRSDP